MKPRRERKTFSILGGEAEGEKRGARKGKEGTALVRFGERGKGQTMPEIAEGETLGPVARELKVDYCSGDGPQRLDCARCWGLCSGISLARLMR